MLRLHTVLRHLQHVLESHKLRVHALFDVHRLHEHFVLTSLHVLLFMHVNEVPSPGGDVCVEHVFNHCGAVQFGRVGNVCMCTFLYHLGISQKERTKSDSRKRHYVLLLGDVEPSVRLP